MSEDDLRQFQALLMHAALDRAPLPGLNRVLDFPDLDALRENETRLLSTENLVQPHLLDDAVRLIAPEQIAAHAAEVGPFPYLRFQPPEIQDGRTGLSLQLWTGFDDVEPLPLGALVANFERDTNGNWLAVEPSAALAY